MARIGREFNDPETVLMLSALLLSGKFAGTGHAFLSDTDRAARVKEAVDGAQALISEVTSRFPDEEPPADDFSDTPPSPAPAVLTGSPTPESGQNAAEAPADAPQTDASNGNPADTGAAQTV